MNSSRTIHFRPHHFLCTLGFQGKGYSIPFVKNFQNIVEQLNADPDSLIQVTKGLDQICGSCPNKKENNSCDKQTKIERLDKAHQTILGLEENQIISWKEAKRLIKEKMSIEDFHAACEGCEWKVYGVCETALKKLNVV